MYKKLLVLAPFPNHENIKDGMISRVYSIDQFFQNIERTYLYISLRYNWVKYIEYQNNVHIYNLNIFRHFFRICKIVLSAETIYVHSIHMIKHIWFLLFFLNTREIILDAHGAVPEEEKFFKNRKIILLFYVIVEKIVFNYVRKVICVTNSMKTHFINKYPNYKGTYYVYSILPSNITTEQSQNLEKSDDKVIILYSGGISPWQKVDYMLKIIEKNQAPNIIYIILTGHINEFKEMISQYSINEQNLKLDSVNPSELSKYYELADYGFILRDDNTVNNVANPTKMVEYLHYGIIPIVLTPNIGDYAKRGMEYIVVDKFDTNIKKPSVRSQKNISIINDLIRENKEINVLDILNK